MVGVVDLLGRFEGVVDAVGVVELEGGREKGGREGGREEGRSVIVSRDGTCYFVAPSLPPSLPPYIGYPAREPLSPGQREFLSLEFIHDVDRNPHHQGTKEGAHHPIEPKKRREGGREGGREGQFVYKGNLCMTFTGTSTTEAPKKVRIIR